MMKLDAKLVAYLAGVDEEEEEDIPSVNEMEATTEAQLLLERFENSSPINHLIDEMIEQSYRAQKLEIFKRISAIKLQMEALTLQPEGTKRMELLQSEIRPIFTVECQLSHELIRNMPRYDMFHIMQFESEKFQSLTQCTRFGQEAKRNVSLSLEDDYNVEKKAANFGRIHFAVWWREPGTCLNEMLGMGVLELEELYKASLLEQCKCITINRRGIHLASLYLKISLQLQRYTTSEDVQQLQQLLDQTSIKQWNTAVDNNGNTTTSTTGGANGKGDENKGNPQQQQQQQKNDNKICSTQCSGGGGDNPTTAATIDNENNSGEYDDAVERFLYLKDTEIQ